MGGSLSWAELCPPNSQLKLRLRVGLCLEAGPVQKGVRYKAVPHPIRPASPSEDITTERWPSARPGERPQRAPTLLEPGSRNSGLLNRARSWPVVRAASGAGVGGGMSVVAAGADGVSPRFSS